MPPPAATGPSAAPARPLDEKGVSSYQPDRSRASVVIPTYQRSAGLRRCLEALLAGELDGISLALHVVDDGSRDDTAEVVRTLQARCPPGVTLHYHRQENAGAGAARNRGVTECDTDLVLFTDDDCVPDPGWARALVRHPWPADVGAVCGRIVSGDSSTVIARYCRHVGYNEFPRGSQPPRAIFFANTASCAYRRQAFAELGGFEGAMSTVGYEDVDLAHRLLLLGLRLSYEEEARVHHHHREDLRGLFRAYWKRGAASTLLKALWGRSRRPRLWEVAEEAWFLALHAARLPLAPLAAPELRSEGAPAADAVRFALLEWLVDGARTWGTLTMLFRLRQRTQSLVRTARLPECEGGVRETLREARRRQREALAAELGLEFRPARGRRRRSEV